MKKLVLLVLGYIQTVLELHTPTGIFTHGFQLSIDLKNYIILIINSQTPSHDTVPFQDMPIYTCLK